MPIDTTAQPAQAVKNATTADINDTANTLTGFFGDTAHGFHHPDISPIAVHLGFFDVRWYSLAYLFGILLGWFYINYVNRKYANNYLGPKALEALPLWIVLSVVLGGRIGYVLFYNLTFYLSNLNQIFQIWNGGMSFHGGLTGVIIGTYIFSRVYKLEYFRVTDFLALVTPFGLFFGRLANFINMELIGRTTSKPWAVIYPGEVMGRHPSQLYEAFMEGILLFIILYTAMRFKAFQEKGILSGLFLTFYGVFRVIAEFFRQPDKQIGYIDGSFTMGQLLCIPMILVGVGILLYSADLKKKKNI